MILSRGVSYSSTVAFVVFFFTDSIAQTRGKENYFNVITLAFKSGKEKVEIPELLKRYVWKSPATELDALTEIIKALPIEPKHFDFKS